MLAGSAGFLMAAFSVGKKPDSPLVSFLGSGGDLADFTYCTRWSDGYP